MKYVTVENYKDMSKRVNKLNSDDTVTGSSNFGKFIKLFESDDSRRIEEINEHIEQEDYIYEKDGIKTTGYIKID